MKKLFSGLVKEGYEIYSPNLLPGTTHFAEEKIQSFDGKEYRRWDPRSSKLCSGIVKGLKNFPFKNNTNTLYLGASHGYTVSFLSDICPNGRIYALDFAPRVLRDLLHTAKQRNNIIPIMGDAAQPQQYQSIVGSVDVLYQDVAQKNQVDMFLKNSAMYLKKGGVGILNVKARSEDVTKKPSEVFRDVKKQLSKKLTITDYIILSPFQEDHAMFVCKK